MPIDVATITPGDPVLVNIPYRPGCGKHGMIAVQGVVGQVDRVEPDWGDHCVVVVFPSLRCPILGTVWVDSMMPSELELADE